MIHRDAMEKVTSRVQMGGAAVLFGAIAVLLQGCLLTRVFESRAQLCDEQPSRVTVTRPPGSGLRIVFDKPTLTDRDVVLLAGREPTDVTDSLHMREFTYEAVPLRQPLDRTGGLTARLSFREIEGRYRLAEVNLPEKFNDLLAPPLLDSAVAIACKARPGIVPPITTFDLRSLDRSTLPNRDALTRLLGAPSGALVRAEVIWYRYCLAPCGAPDTLAADLRFSFDDEGNLKRADARYFRYSVVVDLDATHPLATVELH